jgi:hypothetical protein
MPELMTNSFGADIGENRRSGIPLGKSRPLRRRRLGWARELMLSRAACLALASGAFVLGCRTYEIAKLIAVGDVRSLRERNHRVALDAERPSLLIVGIDGMKRRPLRAPGERATARSGVAARRPHKRQLRARLPGSLDACSFPVRDAHRLGVHFHGRTAGCERDSR